MKNFRASRAWASLLVFIIALYSVSSPASAQTPSQPPNVLRVPDETAFLASLNTPISVDQTKSGSPVEAVTTQDIKQDHNVLLKKGATLLGHVDAVETAPAGDHVVVLVFDRVKTKTGDEMQFHLVIQALAPRSDVQTGNVNFATGRGIQGTTQESMPSGHNSAPTSGVNSLTLSSHGVHDLPGLDLRERITDNQHSTVVAASRKDIQLKKGTQLVFKVVSQ